MTEEKLCTETVDGKHEWERHELPPEQCEGKTHVCLRCGEEKTEEDAPIPESRTMQLGTIEQAQERGEHIEGEYERRMKELVEDKEIVHFLYDVQCAYKRMIGEEVKTTWETLDDSLKDTIYQEIQFVVNTLSAPPSEDRNYAMALNDQYFAARLKAGYRYGPVIDHEERTHPDMVTFTMLPEKQRIKLYFGRVLVRLLAGIRRGY